MFEKIEKTLYLYVSGKLFARQDKNVFNWVLNDLENKRYFIHMNSMNFVFITKKTKLLMISRQQTQLEWVGCIYIYIHIYIKCERFLSSFVVLVEVVYKSCLSSLQLLNTDLIHPHSFEWIFNIKFTKPAKFDIQMKWISFNS